LELWCTEAAAVPIKGVWQRVKAGYFIHGAYSRSVAKPVLGAVAVVILVRTMYKYFMAIPEQVERGREAVGAALRALERGLADLAQAIAHRADPLAVSDAPIPSEARRRVIEAYAQIDYGAEDDARSTPVCLGVMGTTREVVALAERVNEAKAQLRAVCSAMHGVKVRLPTSADVRAPTELVPLTRAILRSIQRSDLNLIAAYRRIPILDVRPTVVAFTQAYTRRVQRRERSELVEILRQSSRPGADRDLARLRACRDRWLAVVEPHYANVRANVWFDGLDARGRGRVQVAAELPLLYARGRSAMFPDVRWPHPRVSHGPTRDRTGRLAEEPLLETLSVFRYAD
jgi:hypothetical protein